MNNYDVNQEPIVLSKATLDRFLKEDKPGDLIALYTFYYYTAKWQRTNQPKSTTHYTAKGLKWSVDKVRKNKKILINLNLIEDIVTKDKTNKITGHYIKVKFIWTEEAINKSQTTQKAEGGKSQRVGKTTPNALSSNNLNSLSSNIKSFSKEKLSVSKETPNGFFQNLSNEDIPSNTSEGECLNFWNELPLVTQHIRQGTNTRKTCQKYISQLINGTFCQNKKFKIGFWNDYKIPIEWESKKWTIQEIKEGMKRLSLIQQEGYWPVDKDKLQKDLPSLLFNPFAKRCSSYFFLVMIQKPKTLTKKPKNNSIKPQSDNQPYPVDEEIGDCYHDTTPYPVDEEITLDV